LFGEFTHSQHNGFGQAGSVFASGVGFDQSAQGVLQLIYVIARADG
jgi:hypothetical protein